MNIKTRNFGTIEINEDKIIYFNDGIPGFPELKKYLLMMDNEDNSPFYWLQSIEDTDIAFVMIDIFRFIPNYSPKLPKEELNEIGQYNEGDLLIYTIAVIPENPKKMTVNLKAPIIINTKNNKGRQIIADNDDYSIKYYLYEQLSKNKKVGE